MEASFRKHAVGAARVDRAGREPLRGCTHPRWIATTSRADSRTFLERLSASGAVLVNHVRLVAPLDTRDGDRSPSTIDLADDPIVSDTVPPIACQPALQRPSHGVWILHDSDPGQKIRFNPATDRSIQFRELNSSTPSELDLPSRVRQRPLPRGTSRLSLAQFARSSR